MGHNLIILGLPLDQGERSVPYLTRSASLTDFDRLARSLGLDPMRLLRAAKLPAACFSDPDLIISASSVAWMLEEASRLSGKQDFGLRLAETRRLANFGELALVIREEPTLRHAIESFSRYMRLHNEALHLGLTDTDDLVLLQVIPKGGNLAALRQTIEMSIGILLRTLKLLTNGAFRPVSIYFTHERPSDLRFHSKILGSSLQFNQEMNAIVCRAADLSVPIASADPEIGRQVKRRADQRLNDMEETPEERVRQVIRLLLPMGTCSVTRIAHHLGIDRRTLHRHLAARGGAYKLIDEIRSDLAASYLKTGRRTGYDIAELLGFSSASAFSRWFHRQFGTSPSAWLKSQSALPAMSQRVKKLSHRANS
jgi:AraC-like DNA-binding protein